MFAVRFLALAALTVWLGGMITLLVLPTPWTPDALLAFHLLAAACGGLTLVSLFVIKFVGPPPPGFVPRAAIVVVMLLVTLYSGLVAHGGPLGGVFAVGSAAAVPGPITDGALAPARALQAINIACGLLLLSWYARE